MASFKRVLQFYIMLLVHFIDRHGFYDPGRLGLICVKQNACPLCKWTPVVVDTRHGNECTKYDVKLLLGLTFKHKNNYVFY